MTMSVISPCERYRYKLWRGWGDPARRCVWVMLNPSVADAYKDDRTLTRCIGFSRSWGFGALDVVNLYAYRTPYPQDMWAFKGDRVGPDNDQAIIEAVRKASRIVLAWGAHAREPRESEVTKLVMEHAPCEVGCLGKTEKEAKPNHPLMLRADRAFDVLYDPKLRRFPDTL